MNYDTVFQSLEEILSANFGVRIYKLSTVIKIISDWNHVIGYDLLPFVGMTEVIEEGYVYYETSTKVINKAELWNELGVESDEVFIVISGDAYGVHPDKEFAHLAIHESDDDMECLEWNQDTTNEPIGEK